MLQISDQCSPIHTHPNVLLYFGMCVYGRMGETLLCLLAGKAVSGLNSISKMIHSLDNYHFHDVTLVTLLNRGLTMSAILSLLGFSILNILHFCLVGCICLRDSVQLHKCLLSKYYWLHAVETMVILNNTLTPESLQSSGDALLLATSLLKPVTQETTSV